MSEQPTKRAANTILQVEDNADAREFISECMVALGYKVLVASDAKNALAVLEQHAGPVELLVTHIVMPGILGHELAKKVRAMRPGISVLYISGYPEESVWELGRHKEDNVYVSRPFTLQSLDTGIRKALGVLRSVILVVDGDPEGRAFLRNTLQPAGYDVMEAANWELALDILRNKAVDLVIVDAARVETGEEQSIRGLRRVNRRARVLALTGKFPVFSKSPAFVQRPPGPMSGMAPEHLKARWRLGAHATLPKPVSTRTLFETIRRVLEG